MLLLEHPLSSYVQKVKIALREKDTPFTVEIPQDLGSGRSGGAFKAANPRIEVPGADRRTAPYLRFDRDYGIHRRALAGSASDASRSGGSGLCTHY
jgi:glutathione S-transferase